MWEDEFCLFGMTKLEPVSTFDSCPLRNTSYFFPIQNSQFANRNLPPSSFTAYLSPSKGNPMSNDTPPILKTPNPLTVKFTLNRWDLFRLNLRVSLRNRIVILFGLVIALGMSWLIMSAPELAAYPLGLRIVTLLALTALQLLGMMLIQLTFLALYIGLKKYPGILCEHELEIRDDGLVERTSVNESLHRWAGFQKVVSNNSYLYIYVTNVMIHLVPKRYFTSEHEAQSFQHEIEKRIKAR